MCLQQLGDIFINPTTHCKRFYKYFIHIHMVTRSHTQFEITDDLSVCDSSEPNLKNFCGKQR